MRRLHALLMTAGLMAAPVSAVAGPDKQDTNSNDPQTQTFEWSMSTGRARLGVMVMGLTPELREHFGAPKDKGVMVARVEPSSSASAAGVQVGDIVTDVRGEPVDSAVDVLDALSEAKKNDSVAISVIRDHKPLALSAKMLNDPGPKMPKMMMGEPEWPDWVQDFFDSGPGWMHDHHHDQDHDARSGKRT